MNNLRVKKMDQRNDVILTIYTRKQLFMVLKIMESEGRNQSDVLRILIEIGLFTLLDNPKEIERRLRRIQGTDKNALLVYLRQPTEN